MAPPQPYYVLLLRAGDPSPELLARAGHYDDWFRVAFGRSVELKVVNAHLGEALPDPSPFHAVVMSGSPASVTEHLPWMKHAGRYLVDAAEKGKPVLGVCFGHQLLAQALGGKVTSNPRGREIGTIRCQLTAAGQADPLFAGLGPELEVQATHVDAVVELPRGATLLAENAFGVQAFAAGDRIRAVQFHPELSVEHCRALVETREVPLRAEGIYERTLAGLRPTPAGKQLMGNFMEWAWATRRAD